MSYGVGLYKFADGAIVPPDIEVVRAVLAPYMAAPEKVAEGRNDFWIRTPDGGEADLMPRSCCREAHFRPEHHAPSSGGRRGQKVPAQCGRG